MARIVHLYPHLENCMTDKNTSVKRWEENTSHSVNESYLWEVGYQEILVISKSCGFFKLSFDTYYLCES